MSSASVAPAVSARRPIVVDLDGTLVATDTLWELIVTFVKQNPLHIFLLFKWLFSGKASFKAKLAKGATLDVESLPYRAECIAWLQSEKQNGRKIFLATGADSTLAEAIAKHLDLFDGVIASDGITNATGSRKSELIAQVLKNESFDYAGNALIDIEVWRKSLSAIVVAPDRGVIKALKSQNIAIAQLFPAAPTSLRTWLKQLRVYQWMKNLLIFTPLVASHRLHYTVGWTHAACGFVVFSLVASATYLINDLLDLPADRRHPTKRRRPLAAGLISIPSALGVVFVLLSSAVMLSAFLPLRATALVFSYSIATICYSIFLKKMLMLDVVSLALFYTARLMYGGLITNISISSWALAFCAFTFFSLAAVKRINDLAKANLKASESLRHRAYQALDLNALVSLAASTSGIAVLVLILYINSDQGQKLYHHPQILWTMSVPLLYWFSRILTLANRGALADDPILFAARDRATYIVLALMGVIAIAATY